MMGRQPEACSLGRFARSTESRREGAVLCVADTHVFAFRVVGKKTHSFTCTRSLVGWRADRITKKGVGSPGLRGKKSGSGDKLLGIPDRVSGVEKRLGTSGALGCE